MGKTVISGGTIVNEGRCIQGYVEIEGERIVRVSEGAWPGAQADDAVRVIEACGRLVLPGVIDDQVHFREPGLTHKGDIHSESAAAVAGGVTSFMDMPNSRPPTTTRTLLAKKFDRAAETSLANYSFYLGAANDNIEEIKAVDPRLIPGIKVFMGSSTGNMLIDNDKSLSAIFAESPVPIAAHCEDEAAIQANLIAFRTKYGKNITSAMHPLIRSAEACYRSSAKAVRLADRYNANLHVLHLSTARELGLFEKKPLADKKITNEVCIHHLWFTDADYARLGNFIKWNPAIKTAADRDALRAALTGGLADVVATDHAPHTFEEKSLPYPEDPSGGPLIQHSLVAMLELSRQGVLPLETVVEKMCHAPAIRFKIKDRGFLRPGFFADIAIVDPKAPWTVTPETIRAKCGWSPFLGETFSHTVTHTVVNGSVVWENGELDIGFRGQRLVFDR